jgi:hypothetical protein
LNKLPQKCPWQAETVQVASEPIPHQSENQTVAIPIHHPLPIIKAKLTKAKKKIVLIKH